MSPLPFFTDSLARKMLSAPVHEGALSFYACGITPYAPAHIGHARSFVVFDAMASALRRSGREVVVVRNITDIDDKILAAAKAAGKDWHAFAHAQAAINRTQMAQLGVKGYEEPSASDHIPDIIALIERLMIKGHAYASRTGDVLFDAASFEGAKLMPHKPQDLRAYGQGRVDHEGKRAPGDFVLWKSAKPREPWWPSPWGNGRPGWHIECSAMIERRFGNTVDYHGGGTDLRFPHHQAEIQQSEAAYGRPLAHRWVHHGSVRDGEGKKMSKSLGNYVELSEALNEAEALLPGAGGAALRLALLSSLWTRPLDWDGSLLPQAAGHLQSWAQAASDASPNPAAAQPVLGALADNLNTPRAIAALHVLAREALRGNAEAAGGVAAGLEALGIEKDVYRPLSEVKKKQARVSVEAVELLELRERLRAQKAWAEADEARAKLHAMGLDVEDTPQGARLRARR